MSYVESILLGLVQGLGEFLPISSSAHLVILPWFIQFKDPGLGFDVALHLGTLLAVGAFFWRDWWEISSGSLMAMRRWEAASAGAKQRLYLLLALIVATVPAAIAGVLLDKWAETTLRHPVIVAVNMILLGTLLFLADRKTGNTKTLSRLKLSSAFLIGLAQGLAVFPGVSRSGVTITAALALGFTRTEAARFSFLMSTPIILGACVFKYKYFIEAFADSRALVGIAVSAVFGFLSIKYLLRLVKMHSYGLFVWYRWVFGLGVIALYGLRQS